MDELRESLYAMGFEADRVDWALRDNPGPNPELDRALEHIFEHEGQPVPLAVRRPVPAPPRPISPLRAVLPAAVPVASSPTPSSPTTIEVIRIPREEAPTPQARRVILTEPYAAALARYRTFLEREQRLENAPQEAFTAARAFFDEEIAYRREFYNIPEEPIVVRPPSTQPAASEFSSAEDAGFEIIDASPRAPDALPATASTSTTSGIERQLIPPSEELAQVLSLVQPLISKVKNTTIEEALNRARQLQPQLSEKIFSLRQVFDSGNARYAYDPVEAEQDRQRQEAQDSRLAQMYNDGQYDAANYAIKVFHEETAARDKDKGQVELTQWENNVIFPIDEFWEEYRPKMKACYADVEKALAEGGLSHLEGGTEGVDLEHALRALNYISDMIEDWWSTMERFEDDTNERRHSIRMREHDYSTSDTVLKERADAEAKHSLQNQETAASRYQAKVQRLSTHIALLSSVLTPTLTSITELESNIGAALRHQASAIPESHTVAEEESQLKTGDQTWSRIPIPSEPLIAQLSQTTTAIYSLQEVHDALANLAKSAQDNLRQALQQLNVADKQLRAMESGSRFDYFSPELSSARQKLDQETAAEDSKMWESKKKRTAERDEVVGPITKIITKHNDRKRDELMKIASGDGAGGSGGMSAAEAMQRLQQDQMRTQMISNMMWSQHASRMSVINNIGSSNTQWVVGRR